MTVYEFISRLQEALDRANTYSIPNREVLIVFVAPNSGFCGPTIRPRFLGYIGEVAKGVPAEGRYGLNRIQIEHILEAFDVTLAPEDSIL